MKSIRKLTSLIILSVVLCAFMGVQKAQAVITFSLELDNATNPNVTITGWLHNTVYYPNPGPVEYPLFNGDSLFVTVTSNSGNLALGNFVLYKYVNGVLTWTYTYPVYVPGGNTPLHKIANIHFDSVTGAFSVTWDY